MNIEVLKQAAKDIRDGSMMRFNMQQYARGPIDAEICRTAGCIAGHILVPLHSAI